MEKTELTQQAVAKILTEKCQKLVNKPSENGVKATIFIFDTVSKMNKPSVQQTEGLAKVESNKEKTLTLEREAENIPQQFSASVDKSNTYFKDIFSIKERI